MPTLFSQSKKRKMLSDVHLEKIVHTYNIDIAPYEESQSSSQCMRNMSDSIDSVEAILRYKFNNRSLLEAALTHSSYTESESYQRLELLGDAVVGLVITIFFYLAYPDVDPAQISLLRSANISTEKLARVAVRNGLYKYVRHKTILLNDKVRKFLIAVEDEDEMVVHGGQMKAPKVLADIVESVVGAVYVDCGFCLQSLWTIIRELLEPMVMLDVLEKQPQPITMLYEACQKEGKFVDIKNWRKGERNIASVYVDGKFIASGSSENKENAKLHAAEVAVSKLTRLKSIDVISSSSSVHMMYPDCYKSECSRDMENSIAAVEAILRYNFKKKSLLEAALTHSSYTESRSYQRLEILGDSVLGLAITNFVYLAYPDVDPGQISLLRAANISTEKLARVAVRNRLHKYVRHKTILLNDKVREFVIAVEEEEEMVVHGGQMKAPKVLADIVESVAGAVFEDCDFNLQILWVVIRELLEPMVMLNVLEKQPQPITNLYEACQKEGKIVDIKNWRKGERNIASVYVDGKFIASSSSENKENAKLHAAEVALSKLTRLKSTDAMSLQMKDDSGEATEIKGAKRKILELCNRRRWPKATYRVEQESGPAHNKRYIASVQIELSGKIFFMKGEERSKVKDAENSAASSMFYSLRELGY
ncbi:ribonuclease 3-like protein 2 [Lactuca sativa]|uniref:Uncharacterized protein n=1 Tax=Lactuca sativa TaxID=4236 RepID=A0A9R1X1C3_LACSA|nr:ribonuclease 3-like protein 2 [Lactuca sativa]XP_023759540.1 ribonuclease 3-like protein 2 [Lactuca sativa]KAJ0195486.1 hypothetical protein LSAT_V11C700387690 [Lactuca sativa]